jgi:phenylacetate-CoA ligase
MRHERIQQQRDLIRASQWDRLRAVLDTILITNPFHRKRIGHLSFDSLEEFTERCPLMTKRMIVADRESNPPYGTNQSYPIENYTRFCQTSGTTGPPLTWLDSRDDWNSMLAAWQLIYDHADLEPGEDRLFFPFSFGPFLGFWTAFDAATRMGCLAIPGGGMSSTARLRTLIDSEAEVLCCTPTYAVRLAEAAPHETPNLKTIIVAGEPGGSVPGTRALLERLWPGTRIVDHHGMTETGPVSYECPHRKGVLHIIEDFFYAEIVDPHTGAPLPQGARGELVLTNLGRTAAPVIRYRTGDIVQPDTNPCPCGSKELALVGGILARRDDMVVIRGVNVYPSAIEDVIRACGGVAEYRAEITTVRAMTEISLKIEPDPNAADDLSHRLESGLRDALGLRIPTEIVEPGTLPRFEMKARRWVRL